MPRKTSKIDGDKLVKELTKRGLTMTSASLEIGYSRVYLAQARKAGYLSFSAQQLLRQAYNIDPDIYIVKDEPEGPMQEPDAAGIDYHKLYRCIYGAVYQAMKRALSE